MESLAVIFTMGSPLVTSRWIFALSMTDFTGG